MDESNLPYRLPLDLPLSCAPDRRFDAIAALTSRLIDAPTALVSLLDRTRQVFPGAVGLPGPLQEVRFTPLRYSFCQYVVASGAPLVLADVRTVPAYADHPAIEKLGVVAYAGFPLTDERGHPIGSLCVIDDQPRQWSAQECAALTELAAFCSDELRTRSTTVHDALVADRGLLADELRQGVTSDLLALSSLLRGLATADTIAAVADVEDDNAAMVEDAIDAVEQIIARLQAAVTHAAER